MLYVTELNNAVRAIEITGEYYRVSTVAGNMTEQGRGLPRPSYRDGTGTHASFQFPYGIAAVSLGHIFLSDCDSKAIR